MAFITQIGSSLPGKFGPIRPEVWDADAGGVALPAAWSREAAADDREIHTMTEPLPNYTDDVHVVDVTIDVPKGWIEDARERAARSDFDADAFLLEHIELDIEFQPEPSSDASRDIGKEPTSGRN